MEIKYARILDGNGYCEYKVSKRSFCCADMQGMWARRDATFGHDEENYRHCAKLFIECGYPDPAGDLRWHSYEMKFCPFCGEEVEIKELR